MTSPYEGFPLAASETMMLGFRRSGDCKQSALMRALTKSLIQKNA